MIDAVGIRQRYAALSSILDERGRRLLVAAEAKAAGYGGIAAVWRATGVATSTIGRGLRELAEAPALTAGRVRRAGGGRKPAVESDPDLMRDLKALVEPTARGDPEGPLRWTCKSLRRLADELQAQGHRISRTLVGEDHDTAVFAGQTIRRWWQEIGRPRYPGAKSLTITADGGGSNGVRVRLWKRELQRLADESGLAITVHHLPPGTSKWNAIEHRLFAFISQNWRATPLVSYRVIVDLVGATTTRTGLSVRCERDPNRYPKGVTVSDAEMAGLNIARDEFHGEWNYTLSPRPPDQALVP